MQVYPHRYGVATSNFREFFQGESFTVKQPEHFEQLRLERSGDRPDRIDFLRIKALGRSGQNLRHFFNGLSRFALAEMRKRSVLGDGIKPGRKAGAAVEGSQVAIRFDKRFLRDVFRVLRLPDQLQEIRKQPVFALINDLFKRNETARLRLRDRLWTLPGSDRRPRAIPQCA